MRISCFVFFGVFAAYILASCMGLSVNLDENAKKVSIQHEPLQSKQVQFKKVKFITCDLGSNARSYSSNIRACENFLRNETARIGGDLFVVESKEDGASGSYGRTCNNCVVVSGWAYQKKSRQDQSEFDSHVEMEGKKSDEKNKESESTSYGHIESKESLGGTGDSEPFQLEQDVNRSDEPTKLGPNNTKSKTKKKK